MLVDTHCHLDRYPNPLKIAHEAERAGVVIVAMTNLPSHFQQGRGPVANLRSVRLALGLHPMLAPHSQAEMRMFVDLLPVTSFIGEIGLDFSKEGQRTRTAQIESFDFVLRNVSGKGKILSIHSRGAESTVFERLQTHGVRSAIFHWFTGDSDVLQQILLAGYFLSVNSAMVRSVKGRNHLRSTPRTQILLETDGPYCRLASKPSRPTDVHDVVNQLADLWAISVAQVVGQTTANFQSLLRRSEGERVIGNS